VDQLQQAHADGYGEHSAARLALWDLVHRTPIKSWGRYYHRWVRRTLCGAVPRGSRVLEIGCGTGDLLAALDPSEGTGVDFSHEAIRRAALRHPQLRFECADAHAWNGRGRQFDYVILSDLLNDVWDVQLVLERVRACCHNRTRLIINVHSHLWRWPLGLARQLRLARPQLEQNWLTPHDVRNLLELTGFTPLRTWPEFVVPLQFPGATAINRTVGRVWPLRWVALTNFTVARPSPSERSPSELTVSVVVPARNEAGNISGILNRLPSLGSHTQIIFVEGNSTDGTAAEIQRQAAAHGDRDIVALTQPGVGKGDAVRHGFAAATGDVLVILDADMTVRPEDLPRFIDAIAKGRGEFINGVRLVYPMEDQAMRLLNMAANRLFAAAFTWLLGQRVRDTLCGTKVMYRADYGTLARNRSHFGNFDPFGDFDLIFGAARLNLHMAEVPIRYGARTYGQTNISRWRHGMLLLRMLVVAARRLKFA
jgi:SAM-dependent methyltransferase